MKQGAWQYGKRQKLILLLLVLGGVAAVSLLLNALGNRLERAEKDPLAEQAQTQLPSVRTNDQPTVEYQGTQYQLKKNLTSILLIGADKTEDAVAPDIAFRSGGQADFLTLLVIDDQEDTVKRINIDRDTITDITVLSALGKPKGTRKAQISLAHGFGGDAEQAAMLTVNAASNLLQGLEIGDYVTFTMNGIAAMNDLVGGVDVTIQEDLTAIDPAFVNGQQITLQGVQAELFVRARKNVTDGTNLKRMQRQNAFLSSFTDIVSQKMQDKPGFINDLLDNLEPYMTSSLRTGHLANIIYKSRGYTRTEPFSFSGERKVNALNNMEFYPDEDSIMKAVLGAFYEQLAAKESGGN